MAEEIYAYQPDRTPHARAKKAPVRPSKPAPPEKAPPAPPPGVPELPRAAPELPLRFEALDPETIALDRPAAEEDPVWYQLRAEFSHLSLLRQFDELLCLPLLHDVQSYWYQVETVRKVLRTFRGRVLLADEVGLGKTIEAGMALKEYLLRGMVQKVLDPDARLSGGAVAGRDGDQVRHLLRHQLRHAC